MTDPMAMLRELSFQFGDPPAPGHAKARIEIFTPGGSTCLSMPNVKVGFENGSYRATNEEDGRTWTGVGETTVLAVLALLASRSTGRPVVVRYGHDPAEETL